MLLSLSTNIGLLCSWLIFLLSLYLFVDRDEIEEIQTFDAYPVGIHRSKPRNAKQDLYGGYRRRQILDFNKTRPSMLHRFTYSNPSKSICTHLTDTEHLLIFIVLSRGLNFDYRQAIRTTWGRNGNYSTGRIHVQTIFFVGIDDSVQSSINDEQAIFNDVVEIDIPENYPFVAHKELAALLWTRLYCPLARLVFRADDDIILDTFLLLNHLEKHIDLHLKDGLHGWFRFNNTVHRADKWAVTRLEYPAKIYPPYTFGIGYLLSNHSCQRLIDAANHPDHQIIRIGDAYITGILRELANIPFYDFINLQFAYSFYEELPCGTYFSQQSDLLICMSKLHVGIRDDPQQLYRIWHVIGDRHDEKIESS